MRAERLHKGPPTAREDLGGPSLPDAGRDAGLQVLPPVRGRTCYRRTYPDGQKLLRAALDGFDALTRTRASRGKSKWPRLCGLLTRACARLGSLLDFRYVAVPLPRVYPDLSEAPTRARAPGEAYSGPTCLVARSCGCGATSVVGQPGHPKKALAPAVALTAVSVAATDAKKTRADSASIRALVWNVRHAYARARLDRGLSR